MFFFFIFKCKKSLYLFNSGKIVEHFTAIKRNIYTKIRETLYYYLIEYETEDCVLENAHYHYSLEEYLFFTMI